MTVVTLLLVYVGIPVLTAAAVVYFVFRHADREPDQTEETDGGREDYDEGGFFQ